MKPLISLFGVILQCFVVFSVQAAPTEANIKKVVKLSRTAAVAFDNGKYKEALSLYQQAHALWANPKLTFAIVRCQRALKQYKEALQSAERGLNENPTPLLKARLTSQKTFLEKALAQGRLILRITPSDSEVLIDGKVVGKAPLEPQTLPAGKHKIEIRHEGYARIVQGINIQGGTELRQSFTLQALSGKLSITSTPSGAEVFIDGKSWGKTPLENLDIPTGSHSVQVKYEGYKAARRRVNISPRQSESIAVVLSQPTKSTPTTTAGPWYTSWPGWTTLVLGLGAGVGSALLLVRANQNHQTIRNIISNPESSTLSQKDLTEQWNSANGEEKLGYGLAAAGGVLIITSVILFATKTGTASPPKNKVSLGPLLHKVAQTKGDLLYASE